MSIDLRGIAEAPKRALNLVDDPEKRRILEQFLDSTGPLVEAALRDALQGFVREVNTQLAPQARLRLVQEGTRLIPDVVALGEETMRSMTRRLDNEEVAKVLVRMPSNVKSRASEAAQKAGTSLNSWTVSILERALINLRDRQQRTEQSESELDNTGTEELNSKEDQGTRSSKPEGSQEYEK